MTDDQKKLEQLLKDLGFAFDISGCGCCSSPWVKVKYKGEVVFDDIEVNFSMIEKPKQ